MINHSSSLKRYSHKILPYLVILGMAILIMLPQIKSHTFISGIDYYFHMSRTYETAMQIKTGHFSYFLSIFSWQHNARIINAVYGPIGGYISGLILLIAKSWYRWGLIVSFLSLCIAGSTMYCLGRYWHLRATINLLVSFLYMLSTPLNDFVYGRTFAGFGAILVPLVFLMISEILTNKDIKPIKLALILVIIIEIHLMTFVISIVAMAPCVLLALILAHQNRKRLFIHGCESVLLTILLSFNVWGSILEVFGSNLHHIVPTFCNQQIGTQPGNTIMNLYPKMTLFQSPTLIGMAVLVLFIVTVLLWLIRIKHVNYIISVMMILGLLFLWASSEWFPWQLIMNHFEVIGNTIQFPKRLLPFNLVPLYFVTGYLLSKVTRIQKAPYLILCAVLIFLCIVVGNNALNDYQMVQQLSSSYQHRIISWYDIQWLVKPNPKALKASLYNTHPGNFIKMVGKPVPDYMPTGTSKVTSPYTNYQKVYNSHHSYKWSLAKSHGERMVLNSHEAHLQTIPMAKYEHTHVDLNGHPIDPKSDQIGAMILPLRRGTNRISIHYVPSTWFKIGIVINILTWVGLLVYLVYLKFGMFVSM